MNSRAPKRPAPAQDLRVAKRQHQGRLRSTPRASQACHACAASKTKCDNQPTCGRCRKRNVPCIRTCQLQNHENESEDRVEADEAAVREQFSPKTVESHPTNSFEDLPDTMLNNVDATPFSAVAFDHGIDSQSTRPSSQCHSALPPPTWHFDASFDLFELENTLDWGLNAHEVDFLASLELPSSNDATVPNRNLHSGLASPISSIAGNESSYTVQQAFCESIGQWTPDSSHYRAHGERHMVSEDLINLKMDVLGKWDPFISSEPLSHRTRDKLVAMAVASCEPGNINAIVSAFPSFDILERLINISLTQQKGLINSYVHVPTFSKSESCVEILAALVVNGTVRSSSRAVQKFGYGLGGILDCDLHSRAERNYCVTRDLQYLQAFCLSLQYNLWSGVKNKMELAGSVSGVLINMLRVGGRFRRTTYPPIIPTSTDVDDILDKKWRAWVAQESFKRLVYYIQIHCVQESFMASTAGSSLSLSELSLPLPESRELWLAPSAIHWKQAYLRLQPKSHGRMPSVLECVGDPGKARLLPEACDHEFAKLAQIYTIASLVCNFKHTQSLFATNDPSLNKLTLIADESQERRLSHMIQTLGLGYKNCVSQEAAAWSLLRELASMHLHASFDQMERFAGREGPEEAKSVYPSLYSWCQSQPARHAVWHAGQILRYMRDIPASSLHVFHALACYHASLCLCIYGLISKYSASRSTSVEPLSPETETILLNGEETLAKQRWILSDEGIPMITGGPTTSHMSSTLQPDGNISLNSTSSTMSLVSGIVLSKFKERSDTELLLVANICRLMQSIGKMKQGESYDPGIIEG